MANDGACRGAMLHWKAIAQMNLTAAPNYAEALMIVLGSFFVVTGILLFLARRP